MNIQQADVKDSLNLTQKIIDACGPRLTGTPETRKSAGMIGDELGKSCDTTAVEEFDVHPGAFLGFLKISTVLYCISTVFLFFDFVLIAAAGYLLGGIIALSQFIFYWELFDPFYKKMKGYNVTGTIEPEGEVRQQIILTGHHDSAYEFRYFTHMPHLYRIRAFIYIFSLIVPMLMTLVWAVCRFGFAMEPFYTDILRYTAMVLVPLAVPMYFYTGRKGTPGAGDNLIASAMVVKLAEIFGKAKAEGEGMKHTRLIFLSVDAEEAGLRGSRAYVRRHRQEFVSMPTFNFNMDSIYMVDRIKFCISDINGLVRLSRDMAEECRSLAAELGYDSEFFAIYPGVGGTDAAEFAKAGVEATTLIAMPTDIEKETVVYHTPNDTVEHIEPEAVEAVLAIAMSYVNKKEHDACKELNREKQ